MLLSRKKNRLKHNRSCPVSLGCTKKVVSSVQVFMHDKFSSPTKVQGAGNEDSAMVILTKHKVFSMADDSDSD